MSEFSNKVGWLFRQPWNNVGIFIYTYCRSYFYRRYFQAVGEGFYADLFIILRGAANMVIGAKFRAGKNHWLECVGADKVSPLLAIGQDFTASNDLHIACNNRITIGNGVLVGSHVLITDHCHGCYSGITSSQPASPPLSRMIFSSGPVKIGNNVWIGDNVVVLPNVTIGDGAVIGASSVVTHNIEEETVACGNPARSIKRYNRESKQWESIVR